MKQSKHKKGYFGEYGGRYVPENVVQYLDSIEKEYNKIKKNKLFKEELRQLLQDYVGRPSPLYYAKELSKQIGCKVYLKREDLNHTGSHKINNTLGQALLARSMGKTELIAETGAGQHGVATATTAALLKMKCTIFMGEIDAQKQSINVARMKALGAKIIEVTHGTKTLKDAVDGALEYLIKNPQVYYLLGSVVGPAPYPRMVRDFQKIIGIETRKQILKKEKRLPNYLIACVGGGSNAMGIFYPFIHDKKVQMIGIEPAGKGLNTKYHAATMTFGKPGIIHGFRCYLLQDDIGNPKEVYSIASGLDYPGVGPEPSMLKDLKRVEYETVTDDEAIDAFKTLNVTEGIIPALESSHAIAYVLKAKKRFKKTDIVIINLSGRGDKDLDTVMEYNKKKM